MATKPSITDQANFKDRDSLIMAADLQLVRDLDGGTARIRQSGVKYLPKFPGEETTSYNRRLERTFLFNAYKKIRNGLVGMVFKQNPVLGDDIHPTIKAHLEDIDNAGTHIDVFAREFLTDAMEGHALVLVDMEKPLPAGSTAAGAQGRRPYWVKYRKDQVCNKDRARINGEEVLTSITLEECVTVRDGRYGTKDVYQYRTLYLPILKEDDYGNPVAYGPMKWELSRLMKDSQLQWIDGGETKLERIPVVTMYTCKRGFLLSDPYLLDVAHLSIAHLQEWSDLKTQIKALVPILVHKKVREASGGKDMGAPKDSATSKREVVLGPNVTFELRGADDSLTYVSHDSKGVEMARQSLMDLEQRISAVGLSIIAAKSDREITATEKVMDQGERVADLATIARSLQDFIEECLSIHATYLNLQDAEGDGGSVRIVVDSGSTSAVTVTNGDRPATIPEESGASMLQ